METSLTPPAQNGPNDQNQKSFGEFEARKRDHIVEALSPANEAFGRNGLDAIHLFHEALPDLDLSEVKLTPNPFFVAGMTAGHAGAPALNLTLARACERRGWAMGVGSLRRELESASGMEEWRRLRTEVPRLSWFANLGITQIQSATLDQIRRLVDMMEAEALVIHTNPLQECLQPEGTPSFRGSLAALKKLCRELNAPVVLKETGCGFSRATLSRLADIGLKAVDVSGLGGTHWGRVEGARARKSGDGVQAAAAETFANWGESTADSVLAARVLLSKETEVWASGGVRSGLDAAKLIALGASRVGYAKPALEAALAGEESLSKWMEQQEFELRVALFCTGVATPSELQGKEGAWKRSGN